MKSASEVFKEEMKRHMKWQTKFIKNSQGWEYNQRKIVLLRKALRLAQFVETH